jgi:HAE1 family hydrophobic/amphiphilic exporter-1
LRVSTEAAEDTSFPEMVRLQDRVAAIIRDDPNVRNVSSFNGGTGSQNTGRMFVTLKDRAERQPMRQVVEGLRRKLRRLGMLRRR